MRFAWLSGLLFLYIAVGAGAAPYIPDSDQEVLERLPFAPGDPAHRELREFSTRLKTEPDNLPLALRVARLYLELGRTEGDPRYAGYAQAALAPWWGLENPPAEVRLLRAAARQRAHLFDAALVDLSAILDSHPRNAQARLMRATILQVTGAFDAARADCGALAGAAAELVRAACLANVNAATGKLRESYGQLRATLERSPGARPEIRGWVLTMLAEMAARAGLPAQAEARLEQALAIDSNDAYTLAAYADFLLDVGRPGEVETLLKGRERADPLLLRLALAARALASAELAPRIAQLRERYEASRLRGDTAHRREEARFALILLDDPKAALILARENWRVQKEPADFRILLESALAAGDDAEMTAARAWRQATGLEDAGLEKLLARLPQPK